MNVPIQLDETRLHIFHEGRKRRVFVGELSYDKKTDQYELVYDKSYVRSQSAIPIGPELDLFKLHHKSAKGKLFSSLIDRIPDRANPAYKDYCKAQGISINENNPIKLLGTIGKRGPSSFIFELVYYSTFDPHDIIKLREELNITQHDFSLAFDINKVTLQRIEAGKSLDINTLKRVEILLNFPEVALWQLLQTGSKVHKDVLVKLILHFEKEKSTLKL